MKKQSTPKILVVAESIDIDESSGAKASLGIIQNLHVAGFELLVYHYSRKEIDLPGIVTINIPENRKSILFFLSRIERYLRKYLKLKLHKPLEKTFGFSFTLFNDRSSIVGALKKEKEFSPDLVFTLSKGGSFRPHHALLQIPEWHSKWVAYMHDPYPMHLYPKPYPWKEPGFRQKEEFIRLISEKAKFPVFPGLLLKEWMGQFFPGFLERGKVIPHQISERELENQTQYPEFFNPEKFNLLHAGNLLQARNPKGLVEAFELFLQQNPEAEKVSQLNLIGRAGHHDGFLRNQKEKIPQLKVISENIRFSEVSLLQNNAAVNIILEAKSNISPFLPGKFPHCVMANKPILHLGPENSETKRLLGEKYLYSAEIDDVSKIAELISALFLKWESDKNLYLNRPDLEEYLSASHLKEVVDSILAET